MTDFGRDPTTYNSNLAIESVSLNHNSNQDLEVSNNIEVTRHLLKIGKKTEPIISSTDLNEQVSIQHKTNDVTSLRVSDEQISEKQVNQ